MNTFQQTALGYLQRGFSVIPLEPRGKKPVVSWTPYQGEKATESEIHGWFDNGKGYNIGIVTGSISGITVVDFDTPEAIQLAKERNFPKTPLVKTGKGYHAYCRYREGHRNFQKRADLPGIDLRGEGGYVVAPQSVHATGTHYEWVKEHGLDDVELAEVPDWVFAENLGERTPIEDVFKGTPKGARNESLARVAGSVIGKGDSFDDALQFCLTWNTRNIPPLCEREVETTVKSIWEKHQRNKAIITTCPTKENSSQGEGVEAAKRRSEDVQPLGEDQPPSFGFRPWPLPVDFEKLAALEPQPPKFIIPDWLPCGYATLFAGHGGIGKSLLALIFAVCIALGLPFFGLAVERRRVLYISCEDREEVLHWRLSRICAFLGVSLADLAGWLDVLDLVGCDTILFQPGLDRSPLTKPYQQLSTRITAAKTQVLFIDGISDTYDGNENARTEVKAFVNAVLALIPPADGAVVLVGHVAKMAANTRTNEGYSGSTAWHNAVRARWYLYWSLSITSSMRSTSATRQWLTSS